MEAFNLKLAKLDIEIGDEGLENVPTLSHQLGCLLISQDLLDILLRLLKVREQQDEDLLGVARDLNQVHSVIDLVEVTIEHLSAHLDSTFVEANCHGRGSLFSHDIDLVGAIIELVHTAWLLT